MKNTSFTDNFAEKEAITEKTPIKVCMHVLRRASNDFRAMRTATTLLKEGFDITIIDVDYSSTKYDREGKNGIHVRHLTIPNWHTARNSELRFFVTSIKTFIISLLMLFQSKADIYHAVELTALPACFIVAKLRSKPLIYEAYELHIPQPETDIDFWRRSSKLLMQFFAIALPRCAGVITTTPRYAEVIQKHFRIPEVTVVRNIPPYKIVKKSNLIRQHLGLDSSIRIVLYQGGLQRNRGLDKLVHAAPFLEENIVIVLMGNGLGTTKIEIETLISNSFVGDRVKIIPPVPLYEDLLDWTASADIGLIPYTPSYSLAVKLILPNKLFEYIMAGLPVLASDLDAIAEIITFYDVGQVMPSIAPKDVAHAINNILSNNDSLNKMSLNALEAAKHELNWEKEAQYLIHLYSNVVKKLRLLEKTKERK